VHSYVHIEKYVPELKNEKSKVGGVVSDFIALLTPVNQA
jgi:hypothetical protein